MKLIRHLMNSFDVFVIKGFTVVRKIEKFGCTNIEIRKSEFVAKTSFLYWFSLYDVQLQLGRHRPYIMQFSHSILLSYQDLLVWLCDILTPLHFTRTSNFFLLNTGYPTKHNSWWIILNIFFHKLYFMFIYFQFI